MSLVALKITHSFLGFSKILIEAEIITTPPPHCQQFFGSAKATQQIEQALWRLGKQYRPSRRDYTAAAVPSEAIRSNLRIYAPVDVVNAAVNIGVT